MNRLFVYGTLIPGYGKKTLFDELGIDYEIIGKGFVEGIQLDGESYPAIIPPKSTRREKIEGIVVELEKPEEALAILDEYEEFFPKKKNESLYLRNKTNIRFRNGKSTDTWIYWFNPIKSKSSIRKK